MEDAQAGFAAGAALVPPEKPRPGSEGIREKAEGLWNIAGVITGNSGDLRTVFTSMAIQFSDVVRDDIANEADYDESKWQEAALVLAFGAAIADEWADEVRDYENRVEQIYDAYKRQLEEFREGQYLEYSQHRDSEGTGPDGSIMNYELPSVMLGEFQEWRMQRIQQIVAEYTEALKSPRSDLLESGELSVHKLNQGPEHDLVVRQLVDSGHLGWAAYNIHGPEGNSPLPVNEEYGRHDAADLQAYINGDRPLDARYHEILATVIAISAKAKHLQSESDGAGDYLRAEELKYLRAFYATIDDTMPGGVIGLPGSFYEGGMTENWDHDEIDEFLGVMGTGMLVLSNEEVGGRYLDLPESVRDVVESQEVSPGANDRSHIRWVQDAASLNGFLHRADSELRGGKTFSANLTTSIGHNLNSFDNDDPVWGETLSMLLEVSTRNDDANFEILSGEHDHPVFAENANALKGLFAYDWADNGESVSALLDWIPEAAESEDPDARSRAQTASLGLIQMLTENDDRMAALRDTGVSVPLANGETVDSAAFTLLNPALSASITDIATTYLFDLSLPGPTDGQMDGSSVYEILSNPDVADRELLLVDLESRQQFFSMLMADDASAAHLYTTLNHLDAAGVHPLMADDGALESAGQQRGTLRGLFDSALRLESLNRTEQDLYNQGDTEMRDRIFGDLRTAAFAATGFAKHPAAVAGTFFLTGVGFHEYDLRYQQDDLSPDYQSISGIGVNDPNSPFAPNEYGRTMHPADLEYKTRLDMLDWQVRSNCLSIDDVRAVDERLVAEDGESVIGYSEFDRTDRDLDARADAPSVNRSLGLLLDDVDSAHPVVSLSNTAGNEADSFTDAYVRNYEEVFSRTTPDITLDEAEEYWQSKDHGRS
ncbi:hypothetical protein J4H86_09245 [Spiractinospora alimapuensis]|uniref:TPR repeat region-containing protein n=1 Tax=Spiractinospora alimapuensis TaxID=2820884 RepID=UPI001F422470|nr:hypothetical protein [Spiractinospora alimapuensis]QVQ53872.1 hypothetical protein J4H86_09245 [Spiractinospora alimapuensis]